MKRAILFFFRLIILGYQRMISPLFPPSCRYEITCSNYALEAIGKYGPWKGSALAIKRIITCHPWGGKGDETVL